MGHYWSEMASTDEMERHEAQVAASIRKAKVDGTIQALGEYFTDNEDKLVKLIEILEAS